MVLWTNLFIYLSRFSVLWVNDTFLLNVKIYNRYLLSFYFNSYLKVSVIVFLCMNPYIILMFYMYVCCFLKTLFMFLDLFTTLEGTLTQLFTITILSLRGKTVPRGHNGEPSHLVILLSALTRILHE